MTLALKIKTVVSSKTLTLSDLDAFIGKHVEVTVVEDSATDVAALGDRPLQKKRRFGTLAGKLGTKGTVVELRDEILREMAATELPITASQPVCAGQLPMLHKDPFDRMLIAQAQTDTLTLVTADANVMRYGGDMLWARE